MADRLGFQGVDARVFYPYTLGDLPGVVADDLREAARARDTSLALPVHPALDEHDLARLGVAIDATSSLRS